MKLGYARVSTNEQDTAAQVAALRGQHRARSYSYTFCGRKDTARGLVHY